MTSFLVGGIANAEKQEAVRDALKHILAPVMLVPPIEFCKMSGNNGATSNPDVYVWIKDIPDGTTASQISGLVNQAFTKAGQQLRGVNID